MTNTPQFPKRKSIRLPNYDYSRPGYYFVTLCTKNKQCLFGTIDEGEMHLNRLGHVVAEEWLKTTETRNKVQADEWVIMPNHFHGILIIQHSPGTARRAPTMEKFGKPVKGSFPTIIRSFKSSVSRYINNLRRTPGGQVWQRNYWEHVIRNEPQLSALREYIRNNPKQWEMDKLHPKNSEEPM